MLSDLQATEKIDKYLDQINNKETLEQATYNSLQLKKKVIEQDEFDTGLRLKMNLGHTFGHALEVATNYLVPHGLAVNLGLLMANDFSFKNNLISQKDFKSLNKIIRKNLRKEDFVQIDMDSFFQSLRKDKKNKKNEYCFIIPTSFGTVERKYFPMCMTTDDQIKDFILNGLIHE